MSDAGLALTMGGRRRKAIYFAKCVITEYLVLDTNLILLAVGKTEIFAHRGTILTGPK